VGLNFEEGSEVGEDLTGTETGTEGAVSTDDEDESSFEEEETAGSSPVWPM
jgi:hypothetical protein